MPTWSNTRPRLRCGPTRCPRALALAGGGGRSFECAARLGGRWARDHAPELVLVDQRNPVVALDHVMPRERALPAKAVDQHHVTADLKPVLGLHPRLVEMPVKRLEVEPDVGGADVCLGVRVAIARVPLDVRVAHLDASFQVAAIEGL